MVRRFTNFFHGENSVRGASVILLITMTLSNVLGMLRDHFLAHSIPTSQLDLYFAAFRIPDLIFNFLILGAITSALIPIFSDFIAKDKIKDGWEVVNSFLNIALIAMVAFAVILFFIMPYVTPIVVPDFSADKIAKVVSLSRLLMLTPIFFSISYVFSGVLNSYKRFVAYSIAPLVYNLSIIFGAIIIGPKYGVTGVVYFVIIGSILHVLVQLPSVIRLGWRARAEFNFRNTHVIRIFRLMLPRTIGMGVNQILLLAYTAIASTLAVGSIAAFNFANNIQTMPVVVFGTSFATAVFPTLTSLYAKGDKVQFAYYLNRSIRSIGYLLIPSSVIFIMLRAQIVRLILGSGSFGWSDTKATALTLGFFSASLIAQGAVALFARAFYAMKNTRTPMYVSIVTVLISASLAYPLAHSYGIAGLALGFTLGSFFNALALYFLLIKRAPEYFDIKVVYSILKVMAISLIVALVIHPTLHYLASVVNMNTFAGVFYQSAITLAVAAVVFFALSYLFACEEIKWVFSRKVKDAQEEQKI